MAERTDREGENSLLTRERAEEIARMAAKLAKKHGTSVPEQLAESMGILVDYADHPSLLGFCGKMLGEPFIALNSRADDDTLRCACAHELGHLVLGHVTGEELRVVRATELSNMEAQMEAEANCFAAELLISDGDALEAIREYGDAARAAASLYVRPELFAAKMRVLRLRGHAVRVPEGREIGSWRPAKGGNGT